MGARKRKDGGALGGPMNNDELKMNKHLLHEIGHLKKKLGSRYSSPNKSALQHID
jgi:hypothetical protein